MSTAARRRRRRRLHRRSLTHSPPLAWPLLPAAMSESPSAGRPSPHSKSAWAATSLRSGFGDQPLSNRSSAPAAGFGSSSRDAYGKQVRLNCLS